MLSPIKPDLKVLPKPESQILDMINIKENGRDMPLIVLIWQTLTEPRPFACGYVRYQEHRGREHISIGLWWRYKEDTRNQP